jgi:HAD superfamily hydrolase (TIGR01450 family)
LPRTIDLSPVSFDFSPYRAVLLDLDGTLCKEDHPLPGAVELVRLLILQNKKLACLSNSVHSPELVAARLARLSMEIPADHVFTAARAVVDFVLQKFQPRPRVFNLSTESVEHMLDGNVIWVQNETEPCDAVIVSNPLGKWVTVPRMGIALRLLRGGAACLGICADRCYPSPAGMEVGSGAMTCMMAYAANIDPIFFGKPQKQFFQSLCDHLGVPPGQCVLIGDNLESDIGGAKGVGMPAILSLTGVARRSDVDSLAQDRKPDWVVQTLEELL